MSSDLHSMKIPTISDFSASVRRALKVSRVSMIEEVVSAGFSKTVPLNLLCKYLTASGPEPTAKDATLKPAATEPKMSTMGDEIEIYEY